MAGFVNILFLIFEKGDKRKNCAWFFKICKCSSLPFEKGHKKKKRVRFCKYTFLIFEKGDKRRKCVRICKYIFFNIWKRG